MNASEVHAFLLETAKKEKHHAFYKFLQCSEAISIETRVDSSLTLKYFLVKTIVSQQVSTKAAQSIWQKVKIALDKYQSRVTLDILKEQGLSKQKASYILGIMQDQRLENMTVDKLKQLTLDDLTQFLLQLKGVGPWTLSVVRMFFIQDTDVFLEGDLGINKALKKFFISDGYLGHHYSPYRTYLCLYLWKSLNNT